MLALTSAAASGPAIIFRGPNDAICAIEHTSKLQPMSRSVDHTISMMIYAMEVETAGTDNLQLTEQETAAWVKEKKLHDKVEYATRQMS